MTSILKRLPARAVAESYLASILPHGTPPRHRSIIRSRHVGAGRRRMIVADLEMFDGLSATIEIFSWNDRLGHRWTNLPGGDVYFKNGRWQRESEAA